MASFPDAPMEGAHRALLNLVLIAHAEIRALREMVATMAAAAEPGAPVNAGNFMEVEAECRRKHLEAFNLPIEELDPLLAQAVVDEVRAWPKT